MARRKDPVRSWVATARAAEEQADASPADRAELLLEAAWAWRGAGDHDRALAVLAEWPQWPDATDQGLARVDRVETLLEAGRHAEAEAELDALRRQRPPVIACLAAAELLEEAGSLEQALAWFGSAVSQLSREDLDGLRGMVGHRTDAAMVVGGRRRVRQALGLPQDVLDAQAPRMPDVSG